MTIGMLDQMLFTLDYGHEVVIGRLEHAKIWKCEVVQEINEPRS